MVSVSQSVTCTCQPPRPSASQPASQSVSPPPYLSSLNLHKPTKPTPIPTQLTHRTFAFRTHRHTCNRRYINIHAMIRTHEPSTNSPSIDERASAQPSELSILHAGQHANHLQNNPMTQRIRL